MTLRRSILALGAAVCCAAAATPAFAHSGLHSDFGFAAGVLHPLHGLDHLAQMVLVGLLAARCGGRALLALPGAFAASMIAGALIVRPGMPGALIEGGILAGLIVAGWLAARREVAALPALAIAVGVAGLAHGMAHGAEAPAGHFAGYAAGFALATAGLHAAGAAGGVWMMRQRAELVRFAAGAVALAGVAGALG